MIRYEAWAKVNLYLHVVGRRDDGYHLLDSLVAFAQVGDTVEAQADDAVTLVLDGPGAALLGDDGNNLVIRAARALAARARIKTGARLRLIKRLPVAAGIGGGSADAAATLRALSDLWGVSLPSADLAALALSLGADVPVCLGGRAVSMGGIGEVLTPAPALPPAWLLLVNPRISLETPAVFRARQGDFSTPAPLDRVPRDAADLAELLSARRNDLTTAAITLVPAIGEILARLSAIPGCLLARMSGSGATCFALFAREDQARAAQSVLEDSQPQWWVAAAPLQG